ncbi:MFS transporter [Paraburkholderia sediminicola]|uniref:MFS transporter n=1 Tax=Paraburkholderia sediminicola TaxID=458836 RepID=UPI0038B81FA3
MDTRVYLLAATVFLAGIDENICIGILPSIATDLHVSLASAGQLTTIFSCVFALTAFCLSAWLSHRERKSLLLCALCAFALSNLLAAVSPGYGVLFAARVLMAASCAMVILLATTLATGLARPEYHGRAIGIVFMGISGSLVLGVPVGIAIDNLAGWRATFACIAFLTLPLAGYLAYQLPLSPSRKTVSVRAYWAHLTHPRMLTGQLVSVAMIGGHFTLFAYLTPYVQAVFSPGARALTILYAAFGVAGVTGAWLGGWFSDRVGAARALLCCPAAFLLAMAVLPAASRSLLLFLPAMMLWGCLSWSISPIVQNYLIRSAPDQADVSIGINVSAMHFGVALGAGLGGLLVDKGALLRTPWVGSAVVAVAFCLAWVSTRTASSARPHCQT